MPNILEITVTPLFGRTISGQSSAVCTFDHFRYIPDRLTFYSPDGVTAGDFAPSGGGYTRFRAVARLHPPALPVQSRPLFHRRALVRLLVGVESPGQLLWRQRFSNGLRPFSLHPGGAFK